MYISKMSFQVQDERVAFAASVFRLPRDPSLVFGGTIIRTRSSDGPVVIHSMPAQVTPILKKSEDMQTQLLRKILSQVGDKGIDKEVHRTPLDGFGQLSGIHPRHQLVV